jgi:hypothetical protein
MDRDTARRPPKNGVKQMVPLDFSAASTWVFYIGIIIGLGGFGLAYAGWIADRQTTAAIIRVETNADARIKAANDAAQQRIAELEAKTAERGLNDTQRAAFQALFKSSKETVRVSYMTGQGTGDVGSLINDILDAARASGATIGGNGTVFGVLEPGISFEINPDDADTIARLTTFAQTLGLKINASRNTTMPMGNITVHVGPRQQGLP